MEMAKLGGVILATFWFFGCSVDVTNDNSKSREETPEVISAAQEVTQLEAAQAAEVAKDDAEEAKYSATSEAPLYVTKPMAWFARTNERMQFTREKLLEAQARISVLHGKYDRKLKSGDDKARGYAELLAKAEEARSAGKSKGWPVAFDQWVIDDENALDAKIAEIHAQMEKSRVLTVEETAMYNASKRALTEIREKLVAFDDAYLKFQRTWDKVKLGKLGGIPIELEAEVNEAIDTTEIFINEWNKVK